MSVKFSSSNFANTSKSCFGCVKYIGTGLFFSSSSSSPPPSFFSSAAPSSLSNPISPSSATSLNSANHSFGVNPSKNLKYSSHSSNLSSLLPKSNRAVAISPFNRFTSFAFSLFFFASFSALFVASRTRSSFSFKNKSKRFLSSSSILSAFRNASSLCAARFSSLSISSFLTSTAICAKNVSRLRRTMSRADSSRG